MPWDAASFSTLPSFVGVRIATLNQRSASKDNVEIKLSRSLVVSLGKFKDHYDSLVGRVLKPSKYRRYMG